jgi:hypothetical protein
MAPFDSAGYVYTADADVSIEDHDLSTPRGRLLYLRDVVVPGIPQRELDMGIVDCGTRACVLGWYMRLRGITGNDRYTMDATHFGITSDQYRHLFMPEAYGGGWHQLTVPTHAELTTHINDVLEGRVK